MPDETSDWHIRPYEPGDERQIVALFERVFGRPMSEAHWRWKVGSQPAPVANVWLIVRDGQVLAQYACVPTGFWLDGWEALVMVGVDAMVDPAWRRRGLWTALVRHAQAAWAEAGIAFVLGLPNENWGRRHHARGWESLFGLRWHVRPLQPVRLALRRLRARRPIALGPVAAAWNGFWNRRLASPAGIELVSVTQADEAFDALWRAARPDLAFAVVRDRRWVQWRFLDAPDSDYALFLARRAGQPVGYAACAIREGPGGRLATIADLFALPGDEAARLGLLRGVLDALIAQGADAVAALAIPGSARAALLRRAGFLLNWATFDVRAAALQPDWPGARLRAPEQWLLTGGEFDVV